MYSSITLFARLYPINFLIYTAQSVLPPDNRGSGGGNEQSVLSEFRTIFLLSCVVKIEQSGHHTEEER